MYFVYWYIIYSTNIQFLHKFHFYIIYKKDHLHRLHNLHIFIIYYSLFHLSLIHFQWFTFWSFFVDTQITLLTLYAYTYSTHIHIFQQIKIFDDFGKNLIYFHILFLFFRAGIKISKCFVFFAFRKKCLRAKSTLETRP